jgi:hypothetical protein
MSAQPLLSESSRNLQTIEEPPALVRHVGSLDQVSSVATLKAEIGGVTEAQASERIAQGYEPPRQSIVPTPRYLTHRA